ncbi:MAG: type II toxin-antitoxin system VapB family antitoxin [Actinomycetota bacterium]
MTKRLIDIDDQKLDEVRAALGAPTIKAAVDLALDEVLALIARRRALLAEHGIDISALADSEARRSAWG